MALVRGDRQRRRGGAHHPRGHVSGEDGPRLAAAGSAQNRLSRASRQPRAATGECEGAYEAAAPARPTVNTQLRLPPARSRIAGLAAALYLIGALVWLCGGAVSTTEPRTGVTFQGNFQGGAILYIIAGASGGWRGTLTPDHALASPPTCALPARARPAAAFFFLASSCALIGAAKNAQSWASIAATGLAVIAGIVMLVGAALWIGGYSAGGYTLVAGGALGDTGASSAGGILFLIAYTFYFIAYTDMAVSALAAATKSGLTSTVRAALLTATGWGLGIVASAAYVVLTGPGFQLLGAVLFIVVGTLLALGYGCEIYAIATKPATGAAATATATTTATATATAMPAAKAAEPTTGEAKGVEPSTQAAAAPVGA